jgi:hypothetical protein
MAIFAEMRASRVIRFLLAHGIIAIIAAAYIMDKHGHVRGPMIYPFLLTLVETFLGSFAGALLSLSHFITGLFRGFGDYNNLVLFGHRIALPVVAGVAAIGAFLLKVIGIRMYRSKMGYVVMTLASLLFMTSAYVYFFEMGGNVRGTLEQSMALMPER